MWGDLKPRDYKEGDKIDIHVGNLWSPTEMDVPFDYYSLNWCPSKRGHSYDKDHIDDRRKEVNHARENEGDIPKFVHNRHEGAITYEVGQQLEGTIICRRILSKEMKQ